MFNMVVQTEKSPLWVAIGVVLVTAFITDCEGKNRKDNCCDGQQTTSSQLMGNRDEGSAMKTFFDPGDQLTVLQDPREYCELVNLLNFVCGSLVNEKYTGEFDMDPEESFELLKYLCSNPSIQEDISSFSQEDPEKLSNFLQYVLYDKGPAAELFNQENTGLVPLKCIPERTKLLTERTFVDPKVRYIVRLMNNFQKNCGWLESTNNQCGLSDRRRIGSSLMLPGNGQLVDIPSVEGVTRECITRYDDSQDTYIEFPKYLLYNNVTNTFFANSDPEDNTDAAEELTRRIDPDFITIGTNVTEELLQLTSYTRDLVTLLGTAVGELIEDPSESLIIDPQLDSILEELVKYTSDKRVMEESDLRGNYELFLQELFNCRLCSDVISLPRCLSVEDLAKIYALVTFLDPKKTNQLSSLAKCTTAEERVKMFSDNSNVDPQLYSTLLKLENYMNDIRANSCVNDPQKVNELGSKFLSSEGYIIDPLGPKYYDPEITSQLFELLKYLGDNELPKDPGQSDTSQSLSKCLSDNDLKCCTKCSLPNLILPNYSTTVDPKCLCNKCVAKRFIDQIPSDPSEISKIMRLLNYFLDENLSNGYILQSTSDPEEPPAVVRLLLGPQDGYECRKFINSSSKDLSDTDISENFCSQLNDEDPREYYCSSNTQSDGIFIQNGGTTTMIQLMLDDSERRKMELARLNEVLKISADNDLLESMELCTQYDDLYLYQLLRSLLPDGCAPNNCNFGLGQKMPMVPWCNSMAPSYPPSGIPPSYYVQSVTIGKSDSKSDDDKPCCKKKRKSCQEVSEESEEDCDYEYEEPCRPQRRCSQRRKSAAARTERTDFDPSQRSYDPQEYRAESNYDPQYRSGSFDCQQFRTATYDPVAQSRSFDPVLENYDPNIRSAYESPPGSSSGAANYETRSEGYYDPGVQRSYSRSRCKEQFELETDPAEEEEEYLEDEDDYYDPPPKRRKCNKRKCKAKCKECSCSDKCDARPCKKRKSSG